jgi:CBS domain containing-hemolysin-like protein
MNPESWLILGVTLAVGLVAYIAMLSSLETALLSARRSRLIQLNHRRIPQVEAVMDSPQQFQSSAHLAKSLCESLAYGVSALVGMEIALLLSTGDSPTTVSSVISRAWPGILIGALVAYFAVTILAESLPKALASRNPELLLLRSVGFVRAFTLIFTPVFWITSRLARVVAAWAGYDPTLSARAAHSEEEIKLLVEDSAEEGVLEAEEKEMIHSIFEFTDTICRQVMVPRIDIDSVGVHTRLEDVVQQAMRSGHSRLPVHDGTLDNVVGVVHVKDLLPRLVEGELDVPMGELMRTPYFVPETKKIDELLQEFRRHKSQMAIVVDEFGGTSGLVTVEDVLEEIVGEIEDEYDVDTDPSIDLIQDGNGTLVDARMSIEEVNDELGVELPHVDNETVGGLVFSLFGRPAKAGESIQFGELEFRVEAVDGVRLLKIRITRHLIDADGNGSG